MKKLAVVQSNYIPWKGYFDLINSVDEFILFDDVQFTRRDWRNRNLIKTPRGLEWLTIPVAVKGQYHQTICDTQINEPGWGAKHWASLVHNYSKAPHFERYQPVFEPLYRARESSLSAVNHAFLRVRGRNNRRRRRQITVDRGGVDHRQGDARSLDVRAGAAVSGLRLRIPQGLCRPGASRGAGPAWTLGASPQLFRAGHRGARKASAMDSQARSRPVRGQRRHRSVRGELTPVASAGFAPYYRHQTSTSVTPHGEERILRAASD